MFTPTEIYYEKAVKSYELGIQLLKKYSNVPQIPIESHNNIDSLRSQPNTEFKNLKHKLILGVRKTHKYSDNSKVSNYLVPYTSSGCAASCLYCYLVCHFNKCSYLRLFVNREEMLNKLIKKATTSSIENPTFEIGSNSDLILENTITNNLVWTIENFAKSERGLLTFPTKFEMVDPILNINGIERVIVRVSVNPDKIINIYEIGTSRLAGRIRAINKLKSAGYKVGILIAPVIFVDNWRSLYYNLIEYLSNALSEEVKSNLFFEIIFMTYSFVHNAINTEAFPNTPSLYNKELMISRGRGSYTYKTNLKEEAKIFFKETLEKFFPENKILYMV